MRKKKNGRVKLAAYLGVIVVLIVALVFVNNLSNQASADNVYGIPTSKLSPQTVALLDDPNYQNIILEDELDQKIANKESFFVYFFSATCPHCINTTPLLNPLIEQAGVNVPQFNLDVYQHGFTKYDIFATPTLAFYQDGVRVDYIEGGFGGSITEETFTDFFNKYKGSVSQ